MQTEHFIINDSTSLDILFPKEFDRGLMLPLNRSEMTYAYEGTANPFPTDMLIPRGEWQARIQERKERKIGIPWECDRVGLKVKNQAQTNLCWANAPTHCVEILRVMQGQAPIALSAASVAGPINGYRNRGGWGKDALDQIIKAGCVPESIWPNTAIRESYHTPENVKLALNYRVTEWWELEPGNLDQMVSCVLHDIPVAAGFSWWSHEITIVDASWIDNQIALTFDNSWDVTWGDKGRGTLQGRKMAADDAVAGRVVVAA